MGFVELFNKYDLGNLFDDPFTSTLKNSIKDRFTGQSLSDHAESILGNSRQEFLADREHTEEREDTAYQRAVADMRKAGLNPYTIGASGAPSSASSVGSDYIQSQVQLLGYLLDLKNLDSRNRQITNNALGDLLGFFKTKKK